MSRKAFIGGLCCITLVTQLSAQEVMIGREAPHPDAAAIQEALAEVRAAKAVATKPTETKPAASKPATVVKAPAEKKPPTNKPATIVQTPAEKPAATASKPSAEVKTTQVATAPEKEPVRKLETLAKPPSTIAGSKLAEKSVEKPAVTETKSGNRTDSSREPAAATPPRKPETAVASTTKPNKEPETSPVAPPPSFSGATAFTRLANGFDFPIGKPDAQGYYKARGFQTRGHLGEDWDGVGGGDTDLNDPVYCIGDGVVVFARDCHQGWGNVVIIRHAYREGGSVKNIDSFYGHCQKILVKKGQSVSRGQQIATIGTAHGLYDAHLHLEIRKNLAIGMSRDKFAKDLSNYSDPTQFIAAHRHLANSTGNWRIAMNTFTYDDKIHWDKLRNYKYARTGGGTEQSSKALKKALVGQNVGPRTN